MNAFELIEQYIQETNCKQTSVNYSAMTLLARMLKEHEDWDLMALSEDQWKEILGQLHTEETTRLIRYRSSFYRFFLWCGVKGQASLRSLEKLRFVVGHDIDFPAEEYFSCLQELIDLMMPFKETRWYGVACGLLLIWFGYELDDMMTLRKDEVTFNEDCSMAIIRGRKIRNETVASFLKGYKEAVSYVSQLGRIRTYCFTPMYFRSTHKSMSVRNFTIALNEMNEALESVGRKISTTRLRESSQFAYTLQCCEHDGVEIYAACQVKNRSYFIQHLKGVQDIEKYSKTSYLRDQYAIFYEWCKTFYPDSVMD